ncbi:MAG: hypothetical protein JW837_19025 [Sedimentisphaerales bacterium]|nr:hypothetical protein [Sedimentisphaerales bacterium]
MKLGEMTLNEVGRKLIVPFVFLLVAAILTPPDILSQLVLFLKWQSFMAFSGLLFLDLNRMPKLLRTLRS